MVKPSSILIISLSLLLIGCSSYPSRVSTSRRAFESGNVEVAIDHLKSYVEKKDSDELLYLLELAMAYHTSGQYQNAIDTFQQAEKLSGLTDYTSVSQEAGSMLFNDTLKVHKLDDYEKVLISTFLAIDYALLNQNESALVECRRINHKLDLLIAEGNVSLQKNAFAKYLSALLFENGREYNDAWVDYRQSYQWFPSFPLHGVGLLRMADKLQASQEFNEYRKSFPKDKDYKLKKGWGEVVLLAEIGRAPYKLQDPNFRLVPFMIRSAYSVDHLQMRVPSQKKEISTYTLDDIENTAIQELSERRAALIAKKMGGIVAKQAAAYGIEKATKSPELGTLTALLLHLTDQADLRSWSFLPAKLQLARISLPAGRHEIILDRVVGDGQSTEWKTFEKIEVKPERITFLNIRVFD